jgi:hypothetical protein
VKQPPYLMVEGPKGEQGYLEAADIAQSILVDLG